MGCSEEVIEWQVYLPTAWLMSLPLWAQWKDLQQAHTFYCDPMLLKDFYMLSLVNYNYSSHKHQMQFTVTAIHLAACIPQQEPLNSNKMLMKQKRWLIHCAPTRTIMAIFFKQIILGNLRMNSRPPRHCLRNTNCMPSYDASSLLENQWCQHRRQVAGGIGPEPQLHWDTKKDWQPEHLKRILN